MLGAAICSRLLILCDTKLTVIWEGMQGVYASFSQASHASGFFFVLFLFLKIPISIEVSRRPALASDVEMAHQSIPNLESILDEHVAKKECQKRAFRHELKECHRLVGCDQISSLLHAVEADIDGQCVPKRLSNVQDGIHLLVAFIAFQPRP